MCELLNRNDDTHPDACLLAAAPEMYEALYEAELTLCIVAPTSRCLDKIRNALAKAAGEEVSK